VVPKKGTGAGHGDIQFGRKHWGCSCPGDGAMDIRVYGWQMAFIITGAIGFVWLIFWWIFYEIPSRHKKINAAEFEHVHSDIDETIVMMSVAEAKVKWARLFGIRQTWAFVAGKFLTDPIWYFFLFWLPSYFSTTFNLDLSKPSLPLVLIYTATTVGSIGGGFYHRG
jgi:ACS family hexuronate transporter-like MFS transporter